MKKWISAARLRTLPLAFSCIIVGNSLAYKAGEFSYLIFGLTLLTTFFLQVLSNYANDYGDFQNGADLAGRKGPARAVQSGEIKPNEMKSAIVFLVIICLLSGVSLLWFSFKFNQLFLFFLGLGIASIVAAYKYTAGKNPYGYAGLGDISVFIFFGLVGVLGSYFLQTKSFDANVIFPAIAIGALSTGVLNINNIRDIESDKRASKMSIPVRIGKERAIVYQLVLILLAIFAVLIYLISNVGFQAKNLFLLPIYFLLFLNFFKVKTLKNPDPMLKQLALTTFFFSIVFGLIINF